MGLSLQGYLQHSVLFLRWESLGPAYIQEEGCAQDDKYQEPMGATLEAVFHTRKQGKVWKNIMESTLKNPGEVFSQGTGR